MSLKRFNAQKNGNYSICFVCSRRCRLSISCACLISNLSRSFSAAIYRKIESFNTSVQFSIHQSAVNEEKIKVIIVVIKFINVRIADEVAAR